MDTIWTPKFLVSGVIFGCLMRLYVRIKKEGVNKRKLFVSFRLRGKGKYEARIKCNCA